MKAYAKVLILVVLLPLLAEGNNVPPPPIFQALRANESYDSLKQVDPLLGWQQRKMIGLTPNRSTYLSIGGDARVRGESTRNPEFRDVKTENVLLHRWMAYAALRHRQILRAFAQLKGSYIEGERFQPNPNDKNRLDLHQAFLEVEPGEGTLQLRIGRQELAYGSARFIVIRNGPNTRLSFDAIRLRARLTNWEIDGILAQPVAVTSGRFTDRGIAGEALWGLYARSKALEIYYLGFRDARARYRNVQGEEVRNSLGLRWFGRSEGWDWDWEPTVQVGRFAGKDILAWSLGTGTGYTFATSPMEPRLGIKANALSGDRGKGAIRAFNAMYPRGAYFGEAGIIGPSNLLNIEPNLTINPSHSLTITAAAFAFFRTSTNDGVYNPGGRLTRANERSDSRFIGYQYSLESKWRPHPQLQISGYVSYFDPGGFIRETGPSQATTFLMLSFELSL